MLKIGEVTLASNGTISFTNLPSTYNFYILVCSIFGDSTSDNYMYSLQFNGTTASTNNRMIYAQSNWLGGFDGGTNNTQFSIAGASSNRRARTAVEILVEGKIADGPVMFSKSGGSINTSATGWDLRWSGFNRTNASRVTSITFPGTLTAGSIVTLYGLG